MITYDEWILKPEQAQLLNDATLNCTVRNLVVGVSQRRVMIISWHSMRMDMIRIDGKRGI